MADTNLNPSQPFAYNMGEQTAYTSFFTQRDAGYKSVAEGEFAPNEVEVFRFGIEAPSVSIKMIDGYKTEEEINGEEGECGDDQGDNQGDNTNTTQP